MKFNFHKLKAAIHYICEKAHADPDKLDPIKLNKILWYADSQAYLARGEPITGATYIKKSFGPVARSNRQAVDALEREGAIRTGRGVDDAGYWNQRFDLMTDADKSLLEADELRVLDQVFKYVVHGDSLAISERSHGEIWQLAADNDELPLYTVYAEKLGAVTQKHIEDAKAAS